MPRYYFDIADGDRFHDRRGQEFANDEAARREGLEMAVALEESRVGDTHWRVLVKREDGQCVAEFKLN